MRIPLIGAACLVLAAAPALSTDWFAPGDLRLRNDLKLLTDTGELDIPLAAWPIPVEDVRRALARREPGGADENPAVATALARVELAVQRARHHGAINARVSAGQSPLLKTFDHTPREDGEISADWSFESGGFSGVLSATGVSDPADGDTLRPDGSYVAYDFNRWQIRAGWIDRYWGSGADGSLILGTNARPIPTIGFERTVSTAPESKWLRWFGPWRAAMFVGQMEKNRSDGVDNPVFFGMHIVVRPRKNIDLGLFRTAQLCGEGRTCTANTFWQMIIGHDNVGINTTAEDQPGNQMGGIDLRWSRPFGFKPLSVYAHVIGEDGKNAVPVKNLRLYGAEMRLPSRDSNYTTLRLEYTDSHCASTDPDKQFNCAYRNNVFDYLYQGRVIGHSLDNDGLMWTLGAEHIRGNGLTLALNLRSADVNRAGAPDPLHALSPTPAKLREIEVRAKQDFRFGSIAAALVFDQQTDEITGRDERAVRGFLTWSRRFATR